MISWREREPAADAKKRRQKINCDGEVVTHCKHIIRMSEINTNKYAYAKPELKLFYIEK